MADLVAVLGARLDQFSADLDRAGDMAESAISKIESSFERLNPGFSGLAGLGAIFGGASAAAGALLAAVKGINAEVASIGRNAEFVGQSVAEFQRTLFAAGQGGLSSSQATTDLRNLASLLADAKQNENSLTKLLDENNIKYKDRAGQVISTSEALKVAGDLLNRFPSMPEKTKAAQMLGLSEGWVQALHDGSRAFDAIARSADSAGAVIDSATVAKAELFDREWQKSTSAWGQQFKAVAGEIAVYLGGLIDQAADLLTKMAAASGAAPGSGQERFNALADAVDVARKDALGLTQDVEQLTRVIDNMTKTGGDPDIIRGLEAAREEAKKAALEVQGLQALAAKSQFPNGVPLPASRPAGANAPDPNAARLPLRKDVADQYDRATEAAQKYIAKLEAEAEAQGHGAAATAELKVEAQLLTAAQQAGIPITDKVRNQIQDLAQDAGLAAEALEKAKIATDISRGQQTALLSPEDVQIAEQLKGLYPDVATALGSVEAAALRTNQALHSASSQVAGDLTSGLTDIVSGAKSVSQGFNDMAASILRDIEQMIIKLLIVGPLMRSLQGGLGGLFGLGGGATGSIQVGAQSFPAYASGIDFAPGGPAIVGENGPEIVNLPRGAQVVPNDVARQRGGGDVTVNLVEDASRAGQTQKRGNGSDGFDLTIFVDSITAKNIGNPGSATRQTLGMAGRLASR